MNSSIFQMAPHLYGDRSAQDPLRPHLRYCFIWLAICIFYPIFD